MDTVTAPQTALTSYSDADRALRDVLDAVPRPAWDAPSPCEGWTARDVVRHLVDAQRELFGRHGIDLGDPVDLEADPAAGWCAHAGRVLDLLADDTVPAISYDGHFGPTTLGATLVDFYVFDMVVHRWDVAQAAGVRAGLTDDELERLDRGADGFGGALYADGVCKPGTSAPEGASREAVVLARLGRVA